MFSFNKDEETCYDWDEMQYNDKFNSKMRGEDEFSDKFQNQIESEKDKDV